MELLESFKQARLHNHLDLFQWKIVSESVRLFREEREKIG